MAFAAGSLAEVEQFFGRGDSIVDELADLDGLIIELLAGQRPLRNESFECSPVVLESHGRICALQNLPNFAWLKAMRHRRFRVQIVVVPAVVRQWMTRLAMSLIAGRQHVIAGGASIVEADAVKFVTRNAHELDMARRAFF